MNERLNKVLESDLVKKIHKRHGSSILVQASEYQFQYIPRIPTGIAQLDYALGGGWPVGRVSISHGHKSTGKTSLFLRAIGNAQRMCATCWARETIDPDTGEFISCVCGDHKEPVIAFLDVEGTFDVEWAKKLGVKVDDLILSVPDYAEQTLDIAEALVRSTEVDILIIDSLAFLSPAKEIEESTGKALQAEQARTLGRGIRKFVAAINYCGNKTGRRPTMLFTNQVRQKLGIMFGNPETQPGGFASGFAASVEVKTKGGKYSMDDLTGKPMYVDLSYRVDKNKTSHARIEGEYRMMLADTKYKRTGDIYDESFILSMGIKMGVIEKSGNGWECLGEKYRKKADIEEKLLTDPIFKSHLNQVLQEALNA